MKYEKEKLLKSWKTGFSLTENFAEKRVSRVNGFIRLRSSLRTVLVLMPMKLWKTLPALLGPVALIAVLVVGTHGGMIVPFNPIYSLVDEPIYVVYVVLLVVLGWFTVFRLSRHSLNRQLGLIGAILATLACLVIFLVNASKHWSWPLHPWQIYNLQWGVYCLLVGGGLLFVSVIWALMSNLYRTGRGRLSPPSTPRA